MPLGFFNDCPYQNKEPRNRRIQRQTLSRTLAGVPQTPGHDALNRMLVHSVIGTEYQGLQ